MAVEKISKDDIVLPSTFDVLFHLPESEEMRNAGYIVAHAVQYSTCVMGKDILGALENLAREVYARCVLAAERGIKPVTMAPDYFLKAFFLGRTVTETNDMSQICDKLSFELRSQFKTCGDEDLHLKIRMTDICAWQKDLGIAGVLEFIQCAGNI